MGTCKRNGSKDGRKERLARKLFERNKGGKLARAGKAATAKQQKSLQHEKTSASKSGTLAIAKEASNRLGKDNISRQEADNS